MVDYMKKRFAQLSMGMKLLLAMIVFAIGFLAFHGKLEGDQVVGLFMAIILVAKDLIAGRSGTDAE